MNISPWILGVAALVPIAGAFAGQAMSTDPVGIHADAISSMPAHSGITAGSGAELEQQRLPDHYAMDTPHGRVEVADLAWRGRYRDRARYGYRSDYSDDLDIEAEMARMDTQWGSHTDSGNAAAFVGAQQQPNLARVEPTSRYAEAPHYAAMRDARTGEDQVRAADAPSPAATAPISIAIDPRPRNIDVGVALALTD
ncbi:hypothetical protein GRI62_10275 [Erythrobacter arachoides]|uniref:Uncharacterized protein n=1 Tax=Aurantiacibacter arachoides TaxID=1850444 RepID=A0A845A4B5_9SPHN|nr:hypothetical protein [Aurantiacibacter arachoides]MXO93986.1 hypothetical protein [Aurantiacibacter arachoides]GGD45013.1 hypothetical protein GCM10011411_00810 [Aurantiacibacter arachoides]